MQNDFKVGDTILIPQGACSSISGKILMIGTSPSGKVIAKCLASKGSGLGEVTALLEKCKKVEKQLDK